MSNNCLIRLTRVCFILADPKRELRWAMLVVLCGIYAGAEAADAKDKSTSEALGSGPQTTVFDTVHSRLSTRFIDMVGSVDDFFGNSENENEINRSWMRVRVDTSKYESDDVEGRFNLKLKLVLPNTEQRVRLLVSNEEEDSRDSTSAGNGQQSSEGFGDDGNFSLALRFLRSVRRNSSVKFDIGARVRDSKAQAFARVNASTRRFSTASLPITVTNNLWFYSSSGYENKLRFTLEKELLGADDLLFRSSTQFRWLEGKRGAGIGQTFSLYKAVDKQTFIALEMLGSYRTANDSTGMKHFEGGQLRLRYRKNVWRPWFYYEVWPRVRWQSTNDYHTAFGLLARVEVVLGNL